MITADTSSMIAYLDGEQGDDTRLLDSLLESRQFALPPVVLSELFSEPRLPENIKNALLQIPLLVILDGYWERVGNLRSKILSSGLRAKIADSLIAQSCIDHNVPLIARDSDFRHFVRTGGLKLL